MLGSYSSKSSGNLTDNRQPRHASGSTGVTSGSGCGSGSGVALEALQLGVEGGEGIARHEVHHGDDGAVEVGDGHVGLALITVEDDEPDALDDEPDSLDDDKSDAPERKESKENDGIEDSFDEEAIRAEAEKPWNKDDLDRLSFYFERQMDIPRIAERFGKSIYSVQYQLSKLGLMSMPLNIEVKNSDMGMFCKF